MSTVLPAQALAASTTRMSAAVIAAPARCAVVSATPPEPGSGQIVIRVEGCGVCGSNLPVWEGREWFSYPHEPGAPGHEAWGVVAAVGDDVRDVAVGDRVAALSYRGFAEYDVADAAAVVQLPPSLADVPVPGEPLGCAMNVFDRCDIAPGHTVAIVGVGFLGALLTQLAAAAGARVLALSRRGFALDIARSCGAAHTVPLDDHERVLRTVMDLTDGRGCDRVIEAVGTQWPLDVAGELTRERGRLIIAGFHQDGPRQVDMSLWNWRGIDVVNAHERDPAVYMAGMRAAVAALASRRLDTAALYTHRLPLDGLGAAFTLMRERPDGFLKALIEP